MLDDSPYSGPERRIVTLQVAIDRRARMDVPGAPLAVVLWTYGPVACLLVRHGTAKSFEVQVRQNGATIDRRWFLDSREAAAYAVARGRGLESPRGKPLTDGTDLRAS